jgi:predicted Zn-dependent protease
MLAPVWQFRLVDDDNPKASADKGGIVMVTTGLLALCENDGQLAASLLRAVLLANPTLLSAVKMSAVPAFNADETIIYALAKAGYDPRDGLEIWARVEQTRAAGDLPFSARQSAIKAQLRKMGYQI